MTLNKTYANSVKNRQTSEEIETQICEETQAAQTNDFKIIIREARNEELAEEHEKKLRSCNLIIHGVTETNSNDKEVSKKIDEEFVANFIGAVRIATSFKSVVRIGKADPTKNRPIKVVLKCEEDKEKIMANLASLKDQEAFKGISVTEDYTVAERKLIKGWSEKAKENNEKETPDSKYIWRVRGTPKNGLQLKKFLKRGATLQKV